MSRAKRASDASTDPTDQNGKAARASLRRAWQLGWLGLLTVGCHSSVLLPPGEGSRLRPVWAEADDETRILTGWYDSELDVECTFTTASDGETRCLPGLGLAGLRPALYRDPACQEAAWVDASDERRFVPGPLLSLFSCAAELPGQSVLLAADATETITAGYERRGLECVPLEAPREGRALAAMEPTGFVAARREPGSASGRLRADRWIAEDGAVLLGTLHDVRRDERCEVRDAEVPGLRAPCAPASAHRAMSPAGCSDPVAFSSCSTRTSAIAIVRPYPECSTTPASAHPVLGSLSFRELAPACNIGLDALALGPADDELVAWVELELAGSGRIRRLEARHEGVLHSLNRFYDTELATPCHPFGGGGALRCVPPLSITTRFADPACTEPVRVGPVGCTETAWTIDGQPRRRGAPVSTWYWRSLTTGACEPIEEEGEAHRLEPIPVESLAVLRRITD